MNTNDDINDIEAFRKVNGYLSWLRDLIRSSIERKTDASFIHSLLRNAFSIKEPSRRAQFPEWLTYFQWARLEEETVVALSDALILFEYKFHDIIDVRKQKSLLKKASKPGKENLLKFYNYTVQGNQSIFVRGAMFYLVAEKLDAEQSTQITLYYKGYQGNIFAKEMFQTQVRISLSRHFPNLQSNEMDELFGKTGYQHGEEEWYSHYFFVDQEYGRAIFDDDCKCDHWQFEVTKKFKRDDQISQYLGIVKTVIEEDETDLVGRIYALDSRSFACIIPQEKALELRKLIPRKIYRISPDLRMTDKVRGMAYTMRRDGSGRMYSKGTKVFTDFDKEAFRLSKLGLQGTL